MKNLKARISLRDRLLCLVEEIDQEEQRTLKFREPEVGYYPGVMEEKGDKRLPEKNGNFDWFSIGIGKKIRKQRKDKGITQAELARRMHVCSTKISRIENGKVNLCGQEVNQICKVLGCMITEIWPDESVIQRQHSDRKTIIKAMHQLLEDLDREAEEYE